MRILPRLSSHLRQRVSPPSRSRAAWHRRGFSLLELLMVLSVMAILMGTVTPNIPGVLTGRGVSTGIDHVSGLIDFARSEAVAKNTYVWVGVQNTRIGGNGLLSLAAVRSLDGTPNLTVNGVCNYKPVMAPVSLNGLVFTSYPSGVASALSGKLSALISVDNQTTVDLAGQSGGSSLSFVVGTKTFVDDAGNEALDKGRIILFTPQGQAMLLSGSAPSILAPYVPQIVIGLSGIHGSTPVSNDPRSGVLLLRGGTGLVSAFRL